MTSPFTGFALACLSRGWHDAAALHLAIAADTDPAAKRALGLLRAGKAAEAREQLEATA